MALQSEKPHTADHTFIDQTKLPQKPEEQRLTRLESVREGLLSSSHKVHAPGQEEQDHARHVFDVANNAIFVSQASATQAGGKVAIFPDIDLATSLRYALLAHRAAKKEEAAIAAKGEVLRLKFVGLRDQISALQSPAPDEVDSSFRLQKLAGLSAEKAFVLERRNELQSSLRAMYEGMRDGQIPYLDVLADLLLEEETQDGTLQSFSGSTAPLGERAQSVCSSETHPSHEARANNADKASGTAERVQDGHDKEEQDHLLDQLDSALGELEAAERAFEYRHDTFASEQELRDYHASTGHRKWTPTEIGLWEFEETQKMTQRMIRAEERYEMLKVKAISLGIQPPGSEVSSGFVDNADDGYLSNDGLVSFGDQDRARIAIWLDELPSLASSFGEANEVGPNFDIQEPGGGDNVAISDSRSMVADGTRRRRIDKWLEVQDRTRAGWHALHGV